MVFLLNGTFYSLNTEKKICPHCYHYPTIEPNPEDTISSILKEELEKLGVVADLIPSWTTPVGVRRPDLLCRNAGVYPIEAKLSEKCEWNPDYWPVSEASPKLGLAKGKG